MTNKGEPFVTVDARAAGLSRPGWIVTGDRRADGRTFLVFVPGGSDVEALANAATLAILGGFVSSPAELGTAIAEALDLPLGECLPLVAAILQSQGARCAVAPPDELAEAFAVLEGRLMPGSGSGRVH